jgi:SAM-dependent methyltransferase
MDMIKQALASIPGGRVLDIATGGGGFALRLADGLASYDELLAIDSQPKAVAAAKANLSELARAKVLEADASKLPFPPASFDLVGIANSLHHFPDPGAVLAEALRVLSPGGCLVVLEMHREAEEGPALTHVLLHHWWAKIDSAIGTFHAKTGDRAWISGLLQGRGLEEVASLEIPGEEEDPFAPEILEEIGKAIDTYLGRIPAASPLAAAWKAEGEELRRRAKEKGFCSAPSIFYIGRKLK